MDKIERSEEKILIIRNSALGDVAMTIPVIYSFARAFPRKEIYMLTRPFFARLFINSPENVKIIPADFKKAYSGTIGMMRLLRKLGKYGFGEIADFHDVMRSWVIDAYFMLRGKKVRKLSKDRLARRRLLKDKENQIPYIDRYVNVLSRLGYNFPLTFKSIFPDEKPVAPIQIQHLSVGIAPFARYSTKEYPLDMMECVIGELEKNGIKVYLFGGKDDILAVDNLLKSHANCTSVMGKYSIEDELKIMNHLDLMLTMDSSNQHLASLAGVRNLSIWGSTVPYGGFLGYGQRMDDAMYSGLYCQPCSVAGLPDCPLHKGTECMRLLNSKNLAKKILRILYETDDRKKE